MTRVDLGDGQWVVLRDDLTMGDLEQMNRAAAVYDPDSGQWRDDPVKAAIDSVELIVDEWSVQDAAGNPLPPTAESVRSLTMLRGRAIVKALSDHIQAQGISQEDLGGAP